MSDALIEVPRLLFLGAGFSRPVVLPLADELLDPVLEHRGTWNLSSPTLVRRPVETGRRTFVPYRVGQAGTDPRTPLAVM